MKSLIMLCTTLLLINVACKKDNIDIITNLSIDNTKWNLIDIINSTTYEEIIPPEDINIVITFFDSTIVSLAVCNTGQGIYTTRKDSINISCGFTKMWCKLGSKYPIIWESVYIQNLNSSMKFKINDDELLLYSSGEYNLKFKNIDK